VVAALTRPWLLVAVLGAGLLVAPNPVWAMLFYLAVLAPWLARLVARDAWPRDAGSIAGITLIGWFTLTTLWDQGADDGHVWPHLFWLWNGLNTLVFFLAARAAFGPARESLASALIACGIANAVISFARALFLVGFPDGRLNGWAEARHPILGAAIMAMCVLLAATRLLQGRDARVNAAAVAIGLLFIVATGSRGPLVAAGAALGLLLFGLRPRLLLLLIGAGLAGLLTVHLAAPGMEDALRERLIERGWSNRLDIWGLALREIAARPLFGYGPSARLDRPADNFPHDLFLSTLFYSGAVGLLLLLALLGLAVRAAWRARMPAERWTMLALLLNALLNGVSDLSQVTKGPGPMWYILWLPVVLALGVPGAAASPVARPSREYGAASTQSARRALIGHRTAGGTTDP
jgi:O-antigen ligase